MLLWLVVVYGGALVYGVRDHLRHQLVGPGPSAEATWVAVAAVLVGAGLLWEGLRAVGPLLAMPAEQTWGIATPVDRRGWLLPRFGVLVLGGGAAATVAALAVAILATDGRGLTWAALAGGSYGVAGAASLVAAQSPGGRRRWAGVPGRALIGLGALLAAGVVAAHRTGYILPRPPAAVMPLSLTGVALAVGALAGALRALPRLDLATLNAGSQLAAAAMTATVWLDPSLLTVVLEVRRWRRIGRVRSRRLRGGRYARVGVLLQAEVVRTLRRPGALGVWAALALTHYAVAVVAPAAAGVVRLLLAYVAAGRLMGGLRTIARSAGLRRALGRSERQLRLTHVVLPTLGTALWWAVTAPAGAEPLGRPDLLLVAGVVAAAYRAATRPPMSYSGAAVETPIGLFPMELVFQLARGPDVLGLVIVLRIILRG